MGPSATKVISAKDAAVAKPSNATVVAIFVAAFWRAGEYVGGSRDSSRTSSSLSPLVGGPLLAITGAAAVEK